MERSIKIGSLIQVMYDVAIPTLDGNIFTAYAYITKIDIIFANNILGFEAQYLNNMSGNFMSQTCVFSYTPSPYWKVISS